jgi:outer membrane receptor protein involved in Fe transport
MQKSNKKQVFSVFRSALIILSILSQSTLAVPEKDTVAKLSLYDIMNLKVEAASFFVLDKDKAPGSIWTITTEELQKTPTTYLKDIIEWYVPGNIISYNKQVGPTIGTRGLSFDQSSKTLFMIDGQGLNQKTHFGYTYGLAMPLYGDIAKVEVINGPGSLVHGSGAINGFVNLVPKNGKDYKGVHVRYKYGATEKLNLGEAGIGIDWENNRNLYVYAGIAGADGFFVKRAGEAELQPHLYLNKQTWKIQDLVALRLEECFRFASYLQLKDFSLNAQFQRILKSKNSLVGTDKPIPSNDQRFGYQTIGAFKPKYEIDLGGTKKIDISLPVTFIDYGGSDGTLQLTSKGGRELHALGTVVYRQELLDGKNKLAIGATAGMRQFDPKKQWFQKKLIKLDEIMEGRWTEYSFFGEDLWNIIDPLTISLGARYDGVKYSEFVDTVSATNIIKHTDIPSQSSFSPRVAAAYEFIPKTVAKISYQEGFRWPDASYLLYRGRVNDAFKKRGLQPLPGLTAEKIKSFEINFTTQPVADFGLSFNGNGYINVTTDNLTWGNYDTTMMDSAKIKIADTAIGFTAGSFINSPEDLKSIGFEVGIKFNHFDWLDMNIDYNYCRPFGMKAKSNNWTSLSELTDSGSIQWSGYPRHMIKGNSFVNIGPNFTFNISGQFMKAVRFNHRTNMSEKDIIYILYAKDNNRKRINMALSYKLTESLRATIGAANINQDDGPTPSWATTGGWVTNGGLGDYARTIYFDVTANF